MRRMCLLLLIVAASILTNAAAAQPAHIEMICHRTANREVPENTLESLEQAALLGCDVVEIDIRRTLDGKIVLNHDGYLERLTNGIGRPEESFYDDLELLDAGTWMGPRFPRLHIPLFEDALRVAREQHIQLDLDIKDKDIGAQLLAPLRQEDMLEHVHFGGELDDVKRLYPDANKNFPPEAWVEPGVTPDQVKKLHDEGKRVIVRFFANGHEMDLMGMRAAVAAGADGINVDYPWLGADAVGRPVELKLASLIAVANSGSSTERLNAILQLSHYRGFPLQKHFVRWLDDGDANISRAAALALVTSQPPAPAAIFLPALKSGHADARANAAWALGMLAAPASDLLPLLKDNDPVVLSEVLLAISRMPGKVEAVSLLHLLTHGAISVRGQAALALAKHQPAIAATVIPVQLHVENKLARANYDDYVARGRPILSLTEREEMHGHFRCQMKMIQALTMLNKASTEEVFEDEAFRADDESNQMNSLVAAYRLWDRIDSDPSRAIQALGSQDPEVGDRAEWMLVQAGPAVLPEVRKAVESPATRQRAVSILAWQHDTASLRQLRELQSSDTKDADLIRWAIQKIEGPSPAD